MNPASIVAAAAAGIDGRKLRRLRAELGLSTSELARVAGLDPHLVGRIESGRVGDPGVSRAAALADALGVALEELLPEPRAAAWRGLVWGRLGDEHGTFIRRAFDGAASSIAAARTVESFLIPPEMLAWAETARLKRAGRPDAEIGDWLASYRRHARRTFEAKQASATVGTTILRAEFLKDAAGVEGGWVAETARRVAVLGGRTRLALATETAWRRLDRRVRRATGVRRWHKVLAVDDRFAAWWLSPERYYHTACRTCVGRVRAALEAAAGEVTCEHGDTLRKLDRIAAGRVRLV